MEMIDNALMENEELKKELAKMARKNMLKKKIIKNAVVVGLVLLTIIASCLFVRNKVRANHQEEIDNLNLTIKELEDKINNEPIVVNPVAPEIVLDILNSEMDSISELATYEYLFTDSARFSDTKQIKNWDIPFTKKSFTMRWSGVIKAGIDLEKVTVAVDQNTKKIIVYVPGAEILSYEVDQKSVEVLDEKDGMFNRVTVEDKVNFDAKIEDSMKTRAIENGLLEKAQESAENALTKLFFTHPDIKSYYVVEYVRIDK